MVGKGSAKKGVCVGGQVNKKGMLRCYVCLEAIVEGEKGKCVCVGGVVERGEALYLAYTKRTCRQGRYVRMLRAS